MIDQYQLCNKVTSTRFILMGVNKGMYQLLQSGLLANELLKKRLNKHKYHQRKLVLGLWVHDKRSIQVNLVVDDFDVKYERSKGARHLMNVLKQLYNVTEDWAGNRYIRITLNWDYNKRQVHLSMPDYG